MPAQICLKGNLWKAHEVIFSGVFFWCAHIQVGLFSWNLTQKVKNKFEYWQVYKLGRNFPVKNKNLLKDFNVKACLVWSKFTT